MTKLFIFCALLLPVSALCAQTDVTLPPTDAHAVLTAAAEGVQVYHCAQQAGGFTWIFDAPEATLFDPSSHAEVARHSAGPTWTAKDGSAITGKVLQKAASPEANSVPWLLLEAHAGPNPGVLATIRYVRRSGTHGGAAPPAGCDAAHEGAVLRVPYKATYTFYK